MEGHHLAPSFIPFSATQPALPILAPAQHFIVYLSPCCCSVQVLFKHPQLCSITPPTALLLHSTHSSAPSLYPQLFSITPPTALLHHSTQHNTACQRCFCSIFFKSFIADLLLNSWFFGRCHNSCVPLDSNMLTSNSIVEALNLHNIHLEPT